MTTIEVHDHEAPVDLIERARGGDRDAFRALTDPHRRELQVHCYRMLGSVQDAEDALQDTLLAAWKGLDQFEGRASVRTWLYRVATNRCLNLRRAARRRPQAAWPLADVQPPKPNRTGEVMWLEPYPDALLEGVAATPPGPEARYEANESIALAFVVALQLLPVRQRAVLILRDVLGYRAAEVAGLLDTTEESVTSALKRARAAVARRTEASAGGPPPPAGSAAEQELVAKLTRAYASGDLDALIALLADDVRVAMPPVPLEYEGRELARQFNATITFREGRTYELVPTRANGQPAFGAYLRTPVDGVRHAAGLLVLTLAGDRVSAITRFDNTVLPLFGLPSTRPG